MRLAARVWGVARAIADWWDAIELWLTSLAFPVQVVMAALVVLPLCWVTAALVDRAVERVTALATRRR